MISRQENIEKIFVEDLIEKKKSARGAFSMRGKGVKHGFSGALRTPYHFMTNKEKKKLDGEVEIMNMFTTILNWADFMRKDKETQKNLLTKWREVYPNQTIMNELAVGREKKFTSQSFADLVNDLGVPKKTSNKNKNNRKGQVKKETNNQITLKIDSAITPIESRNQEKITVPENNSPEIQQKLLVNGMHLEYNGKYDSEALNKIFTKLQLLTDGEPNKFYISLSLSEITE